MIITIVFCISAPAKLKLSSRLSEGLSFSRGQKFRVKVPVIGRPFPKVTWVKDGEILEHGGRYVKLRWSRFSLAI